MGWILSWAEAIVLASLKSSVFRTTTTALHVALLEGEAVTPPNKS